MGRNVIKQTWKEKTTALKDCSVVHLKTGEWEDDGIQKWPVQFDYYVIAETYADITRGDKYLKDID